MLWRVVLAALLTAAITLFALNAPRAQFNNCQPGFCSYPVVAASNPTLDTIGSPQSSTGTLNYTGFTVNSGDNHLIVMMGNGFGINASDTVVWDAAGANQSLSIVSGTESNTVGAIWALHSPTPGSSKTITISNLNGGNLIANAVTTKNTSTLQNGTTLHQTSTLTQTFNVTSATNHLVFCSDFLSSGGGGSQSAAWSSGTTFLGTGINGTVLALSGEQYAGAGTVSCSVTWSGASPGIHDASGVDVF